MKWLTVIGMAALVLPCAAQVHVPADTRLSIRLRDGLSSKQSQAGDPVITTLIAPVSLNGKDLIPAGLTVGGSVVNSDPLRKRFNHSLLRLQFGTLSGRANRLLVFKARVESVDNGRESVDSDGVIHGLRPLRRRPTELEDLLLLAAYAHPAVLASLEMGRFLLAEEEKPRITYGPGVELWLTLTAPLDAATMPQPDQPFTPVALSSSSLDPLALSLPLRTATARGAFSDLLNVLFVGSETELVNAFGQAGWKPAETLNLRSETQTFFALAAHHSYQEGPVSSLLVNGQKPALVFEKENNTFAKRHHIRIWRCPQSWDNRPLWIGAATHDIGISFSRKARTFSHSVDHAIDEERQKVVNDLVFTGKVAATGLIYRPAAPHVFQNATGDTLQTDGSIAVIRLQVSSPESR